MGGPFDLRRALLGMVAMLSALAAIAVGAVAWQASVEELPVDRLSAERSKQAPVQEIDESKLDFSVVWGRLLRKPLVDPPPPAPPTPPAPVMIEVIRTPPPAIQVKGLITEEGRSWALLQVDQNPPVLIAVGSDIPGTAAKAVLEEVSNRSVRVRSDQQQFTFELPEVVK
jgi:hypothetical protein